ncbi:DUF433 domain-containing protein [Fimbriiglobus ruber]|uniref:DUF433 domain-containing protein n=1 Tax=Fimbriiglobus ruber TaxID=1908690 RepID=A0A225DNA0_9BACT|nr:DUF433 domain-containing protein [Fimbriiglobus ruber]OWK38936.1 hypothetical protein FRUB_06312 [Fimbriiglobus ruber]OWK38970.1 DUF433 domain-containing protein [Fimbriiglobus ruber]
MTTLKQVEQLITHLSPAEKIQLLQRVAEEIARDDIGIDSDPRICGGEARVRDTRIPVWVLVEAARQGQKDADILRAYPTLSAEGLAHAQVYARSHADEIDRDIQANEAA